jgi:RNA polymerase sigma-70 factor (ECF subfamily)
LSFLRARTDVDAAEELAQQVFADATRAFERQKQAPDDVLAWLYTVASRRLADEIRRRARSAERLAQLEMVVPPPEQVDQYGREVSRSLRRALQTLSAEDRTVVTARLLEGMSFVELADRLGVSVPACKMRFSRALRLVRASMEADGLP